VVRLTPLISIDLIVQAWDSRVLVGLRNHEPARGFYFVPGGRVSKNESLDDAFRRISTAELGRSLLRSQASWMGVYEHFYPTNRLQQTGFGTHYVVLAYRLELEIPVTELPKDQHAEYRWLPASALLLDQKVHANTKAYFR
jgi:colanic acid biosynthesis protein WcaH